MTATVVTPSTRLNVARAIVNVCWAWIRRVWAAARSASARDASAPGRSWLSTSVRADRSRTSRRSRSACAAADRPLSTEHAQECERNGILNVETSQRLARACLRQCRLGADHAGVPQPEVKRFPREQRAGRAAPYAPAGC